MPRSPKPAIFEVMDTGWRQQRQQTDKSTQTDYVTPCTCAWVIIITCTKYNQKIRVITYDHVGCHVPSCTSITVSL